MVVVGKEGKSAATPNMVIKLGQAIKLVSGAPFKSELFNEVGEGLPLIRVRDVNTGPAGIFYSGDFLQEHLINTGDLLVSMDGDFKAIRWAYGAGLLNQRVCKIIPDEDVLNGRYLEKFLPKALAEIHRETTFTTVKHLSTKVIREIEIPLPPLDDQIRIAHLLGKVEELITQRKQHLQQLDDMLKSVFLEMFGPTNPDHEVWPKVEIRELAANHKGAMRTGPFGSNLLHSEFTSEGDVAVLGIDNAVQNRFAWGERRFISNEKYQELQSYRIFPGDVIVTIMGTIGRSAVIPDNIPVAINTKHLAAITLNREVANPLFLSYSIHSSPSVLKQFASKNRGAIMSGLNLGIIKETKIKCPPVGLQNIFAEIHVRIDQLKSGYQKSLTDLESLYGALSQRAFKGELDLSRVPMPDSPAAEVEAVTNVAVPLPAAVSAIRLPETNLLLRALQDREQIKLLLEHWLEAYRGQLRGAVLSIEQFVAAAQIRIAELHPDDDFSLNAKDYDHIKDWVFKALQSGRVQQSRNISGQDDNGEPVLGNVIELKVAQA